MLTLPITTSNTKDKAPDSLRGFVVYAVGVGVLDAPLLTPGDGNISDFPRYLSQTCFVRYIYDYQRQLVFLGFAGWNSYVHDVATKLVVAAQSISLIETRTFKLSIQYKKWEAHGKSHDL